MATDFVIVLRALGAVRVRNENELVIEVSTSVGPALATFQTRYTNEGFASPVPRELWIDVRGQAQCDLDTAINEYWNAANQVLPALAVACNAPIGDAEVHLALAIDPAGTEHDFFQNFQPDEFGRPRHGRALLLPETLQFIDAIVSSSDSARLLRACAFYREAMNYLKPGNEIMHVAFLWMAVEALTKVALRWACDAANCSPEGLVILWGLANENAHADAVAVAKRGLDGEARRRLIFHGDTECQQAAVKASDGFEHGFEDFAKVRTLARRAMVAGIAEHVRRAILELGDVPASALARLVTGRFEKPRANWLITKYVRGKFIGPPSSLPPEGEEYPMLGWEGEISSFERTDEGHRVTFTETMTVSAGSNVVFSPERFEVWGPENDPVATEVPPDPAESSHDSNNER